DIGFKRWIRVMDDVVVQRGGRAIEGDGLMHRAVLETRRRGEVGGLAPKEAQFGIGIESAATYPPPEKKVAPADEVGVGGWVGGQQRANLALQFRTQLLIGI